MTRTRYLPPALSGKVQIPSLKEARVSLSVLAQDHYLIEQKPWFYLAHEFETPDHRKTYILVGQLWRGYDATCDAFFVQQVAAKKGYGPLMYDLAMEASYPKGLTADLKSGTSDSARGVWEYYRTKRPDVEQLPKTEGCRIKGDESLDLIYRKRPGLLLRNLISMEEFNRDPRVTAWLGKPGEFVYPSRDFWDDTPEVSGAWREAALMLAPEKQYKLDEKNLKAHQKSVEKQFLALLKKFEPVAQGVLKSFTEKASQGRAFVKLVVTLPEVVSWQESSFGKDSDSDKSYSWRGTGLYLLRDVALGVQPLGKALSKLDLLSANGYRAMAMTESQAPLRKTLPQALRDYLPDNIVVEVDSEGFINKITDRFENESFTLEMKIKRMKLILGQYNKIVQRVKKDLRSSNEKTRLAALVTAIIMETGIRPGQAGNAAFKTVDGEKVEVETFGAVTLGPSHVNFIKENFARLEFIGKKGGTNTATLSDGQVIKVLQNYVDQALTKGSPYVFVTAGGEAFAYKDLQKYFQDNFKGISPTDFRKLRATDAVLQALREQQEDLYAKIREFAKEETENLGERITSALVATIEEAVNKAQAALSHDNADTTRSAYINPEILLNFLSKGRAHDSLQGAILDGRTQLVFDPFTFAQMAGAMSVAASYQRRLRRIATLRDLLTHLEEVLETGKTSSLRVAEEFATPEALADYLKDHPHADKANHSVKETKKEPSKEDSGGVRESVRKFVQDNLKNALHVHEQIKKAPAEVQKFVTDPEHRNAALKKGVEELKKSPRKAFDKALFIVKDEIQEKKTGFKAAGKLLQGKEISKEEKDALVETVRDISVTVALSLIGGGGLAVVGSDLARGFVSGVCVRMFSDTVDKMTDIQDTASVGATAAKGGFKLLRKMLKLGGEDSADEGTNDPTEVITAFILSEVSSKFEKGVSDKEAGEALMHYDQTLSSKKSSGLRDILASEGLILASSLRVAEEFATQEALAEYLKEHPGADKSKHSVKESDKKPGGHEEDKKKPSSGGGLSGFLSSIKGVTKAMADSLAKAPEHVQKFVSDPKERAKVLGEAKAKLKEAPGELGKKIKEAAHEQVKEYKTAGQGVKKLFKGEPLSKHEKKAMFAVALTSANVAIAAVTGGTALAAGTFGKSMIKSIAMNAAHASMGNLHLLGEARELASGVKEVMEMLKLGADGEDEDMKKFLGYVIQNTMESLDKGVSDKDMEGVLSEKEHPEPEFEDDKEPAKKEGSLAPQTGRPFSVLQESSPRETRPGGLSSQVS